MIISDDLVAIIVKSRGPQISISVTIKNSCYFNDIKCLQGKWYKEKLISKMYQKL